MMRTDISFRGLNKEAATMELNKTTMDYIKANFTDARTGRIVLEDKRLAVKLTGDGQVGFGAGAVTDGIFGVIEVVELDGLASIIYNGFVEVEANATITFGDVVAVNNDGTVKTVASANGRGKVVVGVSFTADADNIGTVLL